jgi:hypothetical protein
LFALLAQQGEDSTPEEFKAKNQNNLTVSTTPFSSFPQPIESVRLKANAESIRNAK